MDPAVMLRDDKRAPDPAIKLRDEGSEMKYEQCQKK